MELYTMLGTRTSAETILTFQGSTVRDSLAWQRKQTRPRWIARTKITESYQNRGALRCGPPIFSIFCPVVIPPRLSSCASGRSRFRKHQYSLRSLSVFGHRWRRLRHNSIVFSTCTSSSRTSRYRRQPSCRGRDSRSVTMVIAREKTRHRMHSSARGTGRKNV